MKILTMDIMMMHLGGSCHGHQGVKVSNVVHREPFLHV